jgi:hypothetical protein
VRTSPLESEGGEIRCYPGGLGLGLRRGRDMKKLPNREMGMESVTKGHFRDRGRNPKESLSLLLGEAEEKEL